MGRESKMLTNDVYIMSVSPELTEISEVKNCLLYRSLNCKITHCQALGDKNSSCRLRVNRI